LASDLEQRGISTFYSDWEIGPGDSIRQKIDEGLTRCTHFVAVLSPRSIDKPWVRAELDAGLVLKIKGAAKLIPLRLGLRREGSLGIGRRASRENHAGPCRSVVI
jgi:hypothetical protein